MRRWEIIILILGLGFLTWLATAIWLGLGSDQPAPDPESANHCQPTSPSYRTVSTAINHQAPLAGNGSPLPTAVAEDVVLEITDSAGTVFWSIDHPQNGWVLDYVEGGLPQKLCFVSGHYFYYNLEEGVWDEVDPALLDDSILSLVDLDRYLLDPDQLAGFVATATAVDDEPCPPNICAVWLASSLDSDDQIQLRIDKQTKKTKDISIIGSLEQLVIRLYYQPVDLEIPKPLRWLPQDFQKES